jgi:hypothetical protein
VVEAIGSAAGDVLEAEDSEVDAAVGAGVEADAHVRYSPVVVQHRHTHSTGEELAGSFAACSDVLALELVVAQGVVQGSPVAVIWLDQAKILAAYFVRKKTELLCEVQIHILDKVRKIK